MRGNAGVGPRDSQSSQGSSGPGLAEALVVWALLALFGSLVLVTYSRIAPVELWHVRKHGLAGGASRLLVYLNYPTALAAIALLVLALDRLLVAGKRRAAIGTAIVAFALCAVVVVPGVLDLADLNAKLVNAVPALGVAPALGLTVWAVRVAGAGAATRWAHADWARIGVAAALALLALPWIFAELGFYIGDVPLLRSIFRSKQIYDGHRAVHLGEHHGMEGLLLVSTALLLTRELRRMRPTGLRTTLALYLSLLIPYGIGNMINDAWTEQVFERGWTSWEFPAMIRPELSWIWAITILAGAAIYALFWRDSDSA